MVRHARLKTAIALAALVFVRAEQGHSQYNWHKWANLPLFGNCIFACNVIDPNCSCPYP